VTSVAFSPDGQYALSGSYDKTLKLWDIATGQLVRTFEGHGNSVTSVAFSPDGKYTLSGSYENTLKLWYAAPNYAYAVASELRADYPVPALPGKMEQGRYERKSSFDARVEKTKADYERAVKAYNARLPAGPSAGEFGRAFAAFYGKPRIASTSYAADTGIFTFKVSASGAQDKREYVFELKQPVPNAEAENFEPALKSARPVVYFRLANGAISPSGAKVEVNGKKYDAMPAAETVQAAPEVADLSGLIGTTIRPGQIEISAIATNTDNPKLAAKAAELAKLRKENADKATIAEMEAEISKLKDEGVPTYTSDVDAANFKNAERGEDFALIVGVESYEQKDLPKADYAERDAEAVKQYLLALGLPERNIKLLKGSGATYAKLRSYLESWLPKNVKEDSRVFFYFSGHGAPDAKTGSAYLLPWDGNPEFLETSAYPLKEAYENLGKLKARQVVVALDSCFSGAGGRSVIQKGARPLVVVRNINALPQSLTLLAAASGDEITGGLEEQGHGIFTYHLLKGIYSGIADSSKLCKYFKPKVQDAAARQNRTQTPICKGADVDFLR
ncbi:MAG: caspase family protein, partial [Elusimicrobia bacterium]|nr:caspase family protein [Elusimicrobiota bacterium]